MTPVKNGFFRYIEHSAEGNRISGDGESLSHSIAIQVLSELRCITFVLNNDPYTFNFLEMSIENPIKFESGRCYIPDLVGFFSDDNPFYERWGGKVAIEVKVTHGCKLEKIRDFEDHNIPIIEINITEKLRFKPGLYGNDFSEDLEKYYNWLKTLLGNKVYGKILSKPISKKSYDKIISSLKKENVDILDKKRSLELKLNRAMNFSNQLESKLNTEAKAKLVIQNEVQAEGHQVKLLTKKLDEIKSRTFFQKFLNLFK